MFLFNELIELWRSDNSLTQALNDSHAMLESTNQMFHESVRSLRESDAGEIGMNIYEKDQAVNRYEQQVRRKVLKHLAITGGVNIIPGLVLTSIVIDIERIGDYTKNIMGLAVAHPKRLHGGRYEEDLQKIEKSVGSLFEKLPPTLRSSAKEAARELMSENSWIAKNCDHIVDSIIQTDDKTLAPGDAASIALYARYLKRISAHLLNITSSVVNPFEKVGFWEAPES